VSARLRVVVADDERPARSFLVALLRSFEDVAVVGEATSGREAVAMIEKEKPDLAFLDWQMPELDGMGVVRQLKKQAMPLIAFVTAYDEYAVRAFEVNAVDYLLKPYDDARFHAALVVTLDDEGRISRLEEYLDSAGLAPLIAALETR